MGYIVFGAGAAIGFSFFLFMIGTSVGYGVSPKARYEDCRKIASIETCVKHVGLEPLPKPQASER